MTLSTKITSDLLSLDNAVKAITFPKVTQAQLATLKSAASTLRADLLAESTITQAMIDAVKTALADANSALLISNTTLNNANASIASLNADKSVMQAQISSCATALASAQAQIVSLLATIAQLEQPPVVVPPPPPTPIPPTTVTPSPNKTRGTTVIDQQLHVFTLGDPAPDRPGEFWLLRDGIASGIGFDYLVWGFEIYARVVGDKYWVYRDGWKVFGSDPSVTPPIPTPDPSIPPPTPAPVPIPSDQPGVTILPHPAWPAWAQGMKHVTSCVHPPSGRIYFFGGDYKTVGHEQSYCQVVGSYDLDIIKRLGPNAPDAFREEYPYDGFGGDTAQPKHPDFVGVVWDKLRAVFWIVPGQMENSNDNSPGETTSGTDDPCFKYGIWQFDPARPMPQRFTRMTTDIGADYRETWMCIRDEKNDVILRPGYSGGDGSRTDVFDCKTLLWTSRWQLGDGSLKINKEYLAFDEEGRKFYAIDAVHKKVFCVDIDRYWSPDGTEDLGEAPGPQLPFENYTYIVYNSKHKLLEFNNEQDQNIYVADVTKRPLVWKVGAKGVWCRMGAYDPKNDTSLWAGGLGEIGGNPNMVLFESYKSAGFL